MTTTTIKLQGDRFVLTGGDPAGRDIVHATVAKWPGWRRQGDGAFTAPLYPSAVACIIEATLPFELAWSAQAAKARDDLLAAMRRANEHLRSPPMPVNWNVPTDRKPKRHQWQAIHAMRCMAWKAMLTDEMGLGKSATALWAASDKGVRTIVVVCPVSVKFNWLAEVAATLGDSWSTVVIDGGQKARADQFAQAAALKKIGNTALIINYDLLRHLSEHQKEMLVEFSIDCFLILDESHYLKTRTAERTRLVVELFAQRQACIAMSGTPVRNMVDDLYSQVEIVRPGTWGSYRDFAKRHLVIQAVQFAKRTVQKVVGARDIGGLNAVMNTLQIRRLKKDVLDLPAKTYTYPSLQLDGVHRTIYDSMKRMAKVELASILEASGPMTIFDPRAKSAIEQAMRCEQLAQGFVGGLPELVMQQVQKLVLKHAEAIPGRPNELLFPGSAKIMWLLETVGNLLAQGSAPVVFSRFNAPMLWLEKRLHDEGITARFIHGGIDAAQRTEVLSSFANGDFPVLLCQVKIAEGFNLVRSQDVVFFGRDWSPAINLQAEDRLHRMGQKGTVNIQVPIVRDTIETMIHRRLIAKDADAQQALKSLTIEELMENL